MKLVIISHTEHYINANSQIVGWSPTVNEINHLAPHFESITHVAMLHNGVPPKSSLAYSEPNINFVALPALGGKGLMNKLKIIFNSLKVLKIVNRELNKVDAFQLRTPTGIGVFLIPYLTLFSNKKGWYKYAGNWNQKLPPLGYHFQRGLLKKQSRTVTINGRWPNQPKQCITFENPCLTEDDLSDGETTISKKQLDEKLNFCYVGRLETAKGVGRIITAFTRLSEAEKSRVGEVHLVGDGKEKSDFELLSEKSGVNFRFYGYLDRASVFEIYKKSHFFLMPTSASEGFPKVIAEAANFGCVPVVSSVSAISQYVTHNVNGYVLSSITSDGLKTELERIFMLAPDSYSMLIYQANFINTFTFKHYTLRILTEILS